MTNQKLKAKFFRNSWALIFGLNLPFVANDSLKKNTQELFSAAKRLYCSTCVCIEYSLHRRVMRSTLNKGKSEIQIFYKHYYSSCSWNNAMPSLQFCIR